jgi:hypothetical protein
MRLRMIILWGIVILFGIVIVLFSTYRGYRALIAYQQGLGGPMKASPVSAKGLASQSIQPRVIAGYQDAPDTQSKILLLIADIKTHVNDQGKAESIPLLTAFGKQALPSLLEEFKNNFVFMALTNTLTVVPTPVNGEVRIEIHPDFVANFRIFVALTRALAGIHAPERDQIFLEVLRNYLTFLPFLITREFAPIMIDALAANQSLDALPVLQKLATTITPYQAIPFHARCALAILGKPMEPKSLDRLLIISPTLQIPPDVPSYDEFKNILHVMLDMQTSDLIYTTPTLTMVTHGRLNNAKAPGVTLGGELLFPSLIRGSWFAIITLEGENRANIEYQMDMEGFQGRAEKRNGRWIIISWNGI